MEIVVLLLVILVVYIIFKFLSFIYHIIQKYLAKVARQNWIQKTEPMYRNVEGYPPDWQIRRVLTFFKYDGHCSQCGNNCGHLSCDIKDIWSYHMSTPLVSGAHIHHITPLSAGGNHSLDNLELLCEECHFEKHPYNTHMRENKYHRIYWEQKYRYDARVKKAKKQWWCAVCRGIISKGQKYFGEGDRRICLRCQKKYKYNN